MPETLIIVRGEAGVGKTALVHALLRGDMHLVGLPLLKQAINEGVGLYSEDCGAPWAVADPCVEAEALVNAWPGDKQVYHLWLFAAPWLVEARRAVRAVAYPSEAALDRATTPNLVNYACSVFAGRPNVQTVLVDASDWPLQEVSADEARRIVNPTPGTFALPAPEAMYQQALWIGGVHHGTQDEARITWERTRLDTMLPADLTGQTVLDIGAAQGGFCYEALHRGASYATAIEVELFETDVMKCIRNHFRLPMSVCRMDVVNDALPRLNAHDEVLRYDLGLLLNVLHHCDDPEALLAKVLAVCKRVVVETPFGIGIQPYRAGLEPYPRAMHLPPVWVKAVAEAHGFRLVSIEVSQMCPGQRLIFRLERYDA